eukprot:CFRG3854T1
MSVNSQVAVSEILRCYRQLLCQASIIPNVDTRRAQQTEIRDKFRKHACEKDKAIISNLQQDAKSRLAYLKMITPRAGRSHSKSSKSGRKVYVVREGKVVDGEGASEDKAKYTNWGMGNPDPASVKRHWDLFEKQKRIGL